MDDSIDQNIGKCKNYLALLDEFVSTLQKKKFPVKRGPVMLSGLLLSALVQRLYDFGTIAYQCLGQNKIIPATLLAV